MATIALHGSPKPGMDIRSPAPAHIDIQLRNPAPPPRPRPMRPSQPRAPPPPSPETNLADLEDAMETLANPGKRRDSDDSEGPEEDSFVSGSSVSRSSSRSASRRGSSPSTSGSNSGFSAPPPAADRPGPGFLTIDDEKSDILFRFSRLKAMGHQVPRAFTMRSDIREMRAELNRVKTQLELDRSLKWARGTLVGLATGLEMLNDRVDIIDLELEGWSNTVHQQAEVEKKFDPELEEIFHKYRGRMSAPPEVRLLIAFVGSAIAYHSANVWFRRKHSQDMAADRPAKRQRTVPGPSPVDVTIPRREMRGPAAQPNAPTNVNGQQMNMHDVPFPGFPAMPTMPVQVNDPMPTRVMRDATPVPFPSPPESEGSDLSDIPSDLESVPTSLSEEEDAAHVRTVHVGGRGRGRGGGRGRGRGPAATKRVFEIL